MISEIIADFEANKNRIKGKLSEVHPSDYTQLVLWVFGCIGATGNDNWLRAKPDLDRIMVINNGGYQGNQLFIAPERNGDGFYLVCVGYGSCSGCDTLEGIRKYQEGRPTIQQTEDYMTLCLHIAQKIIYVN